MPRWSWKKNSSRSCRAGNSARSRLLAGSGGLKYCVAFIVAVSALAQTPSAEPKTGSIGGVVKEAVTHVPLEGVRVWAGDADATTGAQGQFAFQKLEPGRRWISVYDQSRAASGGASILLNPGQDLTGVEIYIKAGGSISGKVFDEDRKPVAGAAVILLEATFEFGQPAYRPALTATTGRKGEYRLAPVPSDRGVLILVKKAVKAADPTDPVPSEPEKRPRLPMPAFYPGSPDAQGGQAVTIGSAEDRRGVDIQMTSAPSYCVDGEVRAPGGGPAPELTIAEQLPLVFRSSFTPVPVALSAGKFRACGFHPGEYLLKAVSTEESGKRRWAAFAHIAVTDRDAQDVQLLPSSAMTISGEAVWESDPHGKPADARIRIQLMKTWSDKHADEAEPSHIMAGTSHGDRIQVPGPFVLDGLPVDDYTLEVREVPEGCYVKDMAFGGASVLHQPLRLTQAAGDGRLHLALACDGGSLTARVTDRDGNPVSHVHLYVMPEEAGSAAALSDVLRQADVENGWSEVVKPLPPGKYLVLPCDLELDGTAEPILKLWRARSKAKEVEIAAGETAQVTLEIQEGGGL